MRTKPVELIVYDEGGTTSATCESFHEAWNARRKGALHWIDLGSERTPDFNSVVSELQLHPLMVEDIEHRPALPKFEMFDDLAFLALKMLRIHPISHLHITEHLSVIMGSDFVITIQENMDGDVFTALRNKISLNYRRMHTHGIAYLFLCIVDAVVDEYMAAVEAFRSPVEDLEQAMVKRPGFNLMPRIMENKTALAALRKFTIPLRDEMLRLRVENPGMINRHNQALYRDILDHLSTLNANFENLREMMRDLTELHHSNQNLSLNNTMKTLTVISAIFIPLTFLVGVYGMNFRYMPELEWKYGYAAVWLFMLITAGLLVWYMRKKRWF